MPSPNPQKQTHQKAFTLIELLIVVAIIAILAAIAVPNFLEAQTRSKVSRVAADFRTLATAIESYAVDNNNYPFQPTWPQGELDDGRGLSRLSTPISYITDPMIRDPFKSTGDRSTNNILNRTQYIYGQMVQANRAKFERPDAFDLANGFDLKNGGYPGPLQWFLISYGPDRALQFDDDPVLVQQGLPNNIYYPYDPTNGTLSLGDLFRFGP